MPADNFKLANLFINVKLFQSGYRDRTVLLHQPVKFSGSAFFGCLNLEILQVLVDVVLSFRLIRDLHQNRDVLFARPNSGIRA